MKLFVLIPLMIAFSSCATTNMKLDSKKEKFKNQQDTRRFLDEHDFKNRYEDVNPISVNPSTFGLPNW